MTKFHTNICPMGLLSWYGKIKYKNLRISSTWLTEQTDVSNTCCDRIPHALYTFECYNNNPIILGALLPALEIWIFLMCVNVSRNHNEETTLPRTRVCMKLSLRLGP